MHIGGSYADVNGLHMYYEIHGEGPPLLLLHGGTCSIELPSMAIPFFASEFQVIAIEQMGHGRTRDAMEREFHYHDMAEDTVELMRQLRIESAFVFGLSDGGVVGLDMAIHHPERVRKLAVTGAGFRTDGISESSMDWLMTVKPEDWPQDFREVYERLSPDGPGHWPIVLERIKRMWSVEPDYTLEQIASITASTLVIVGDKDMITLEHSVEMFRAIPDSQLCVVPGATHGVLAKEAVMAFLQAEANAEK
jgi:pimeloyl-ACP methyl ester carboxylesterase